MLGKKTVFTALELAVKERRRTIFFPNNLIYHFNNLQILFIEKGLVTTEHVEHALLMFSIIY